MWLRTLPALILTLAFCGCTTTTPYGNFVDDPNPGLDQDKMAADVVTRLVTLYPPARTRLALHQSTPDRFGQALVDKLRARGYALLEREQPQTQPAETNGSNQPLHYVLDQVDGNLYRVTLIIGDRTMTRPYLQQEDTTIAAGYWTYQE